MLDLLIQNGLIVNGTGGKPFHGDVAVENGKIVRIAPKITLEAKTVYDAAGKVVGYRGIARDISKIKKELIQK